MKCVVIFIISYVSVRAQDPPGCQGPWCPIACPPGTYRYSVGCGYLQPEATCKNPNPAKDMRGQLCDYQACYCSPPTVRNEETKECVLLEDCPITPVTPVTPQTPETPVTPVTPVTPRTPVTPKTPSSPRTPRPCLPKPHPKVPLPYDSDQE